VSGFAAFSGGVASSCLLHESMKYRNFEDEMIDGSSLFCFPRN